jgi:hypothetical protein
MRIWMLRRFTWGFEWLRCTHKSEMTDESKFEHPALPHPSPPLVKGREPVHILPPLPRGD